MRAGEHPYTTPMGSGGGPIGGRTREMGLGTSQKGKGGIAGDYGVNSNVIYLQHLRQQHGGDTDAAGVSCHVSFPQEPT